ncbi:MAG: NFACT family protein, partial [Candidatus Aenigmarchaeota archaeon]|nr:NFACT family protein [Candidatus Aenigmarchaeota archaeon]
MADQAKPQKQEISSLDLRFLVKEWDFLAGAFIRKIYQSGRTLDRQQRRAKVSRDTFQRMSAVNRDEWRVVFEVFIPKKGTFYLNVTPSWISLEKSKGSFPEKPSGFCMFLRKHLAGKKIERVSQHGFDRILEVSAGGLTLILEFVPPGNVILLDPERIILSALKTKKWRDREIRVRKRYQYPPGRPDPFSMHFDDFKKYFRQNRKTAAVLASDLGFGSEYANRLCSISGVRPDKNAQALEEREIKTMFSKIPSLERVHKPEPFIEVNDSEKEKIQWIEKQRKEALEKWKAAEKLAKEQADAIYRKFDTVEALLEKFSSRKEAGFEPIQRKEGLHITVKLDGVDVPLDLKKNGQENAAFYYEQAKKARKKIAGIEASMQKPVDIKDKPQAYPNQESHKDWHEKFKWFLSSEGFLVIAGKNADQNELLLKSHAEPDEWCFHADIKGAAFTVIKSGGEQPPEQTKKEAAEFAAANSKAWTRGLGTVTVFSVLRKNLSKNPPTGMNLPKGSFVVYGQKVWYRNIPLRIAIGADLEGRIFAGPESAIKKACPYTVILTPGSRKASDLSRDIKSELMKQAKPKDLPVLQKLSLEEIARHVPFGFGE